MKGRSSKDRFFCVSFLVVNCLLSLETSYFLDSSIGLMGKTLKIKVTLRYSVHTYF